MATLATCIVVFGVLSFFVNYFELCKKLKAFNTIATGILKPYDCLVTKQPRIDLQIRKCKWGWLGHTLQTR